MTAPECRHCGVTIRRCGCLNCGTPGWRHWPSKFHRCGDDGRGPTFAEPSP